jgi:hypothetical protein
VERWLGTSEGKQQLAMYQKDGNTAYTMQVGDLPSRDPVATSETQGVGKESRVGPTQAVDNSAVEITINLSKITANENNGAVTDEQRNSGIGWVVAHDLGHEGFHAHDIGSGLITQEGCAKRANQLDRSAHYDYDPREVIWQNTLIGR